MATVKAAEITVDLQVASDASSVPGEDAIRAWIAAALDRVGRDGMTEVSVRVVDEDEGRQLNETWRGRDYATNVLSFPAMDEGLPPDAPRPLGDIVICAPVVEREAAEQNKQVSDHWAHLVVHGALHLAGYDHEMDADAEEMESLEKEILQAGGVADPCVA